MAEEKRKCSSCSNTVSGNQVMCDSCKTKVKAIVDSRKKSSRNGKDKDKR